MTGCHGFGRGGCVVRIDGHGGDIDCGGCRGGYGPGGYGHRRWVGGRGGWSVVVMVVLVVVLKVMILLVGVMMFVACCVRDSVFCGLGGGHCGHDEGRDSRCRRGSTSSW